MAKRYSEELKQIMVGKYEGGSTAKAICDVYGVSRSTLLLWVKQYSPDADGQIPRERYLMRKELERLRIENQIFRDCGCSANSPLGTTVKDLYDNRDKYGNQTSGVMKQHLKIAAASMLLSEIYEPKAVQANE